MGVLNATHTLAAAQASNTVAATLRPYRAVLRNAIFMDKRIGPQAGCKTPEYRPGWGRSAIQPCHDSAVCDNDAMNSTYVLTLSCADRPGIVHAVSGFLFERGGNIEEAAQYNDHGTGLFFMRVQFSCATLTPTDLRTQLSVFAASFAMQWGLHALAQPMRTVLLVSKEGHCLNDLLFRWKSGLLPLDIRAIISNHREFYQLAASYNVPFHHIPVTAATKAQAESRQLEIIEGEGAELVVLARYMQILSNDLCRQLAGRAINIHHSFLPSFKGAKPYYQAHDRGVKLIGATAHYVTADLDEGPIIEQDVARVDHSKTVEDLTAQGRDTESQVLARAVKWHSEHRVLINGHKTVVFR
jgi:formyltetrahydrofolate deformylase